MGSLGTHLRTTSLPATQGGTGARTGTASTRDEQVFAMTGSQVVDLMGGETTWLGNQDAPLSGQFKDPKSTHTLSRDFLTKDTPTASFDIVQ